MSHLAVAARTEGISVADVDRALYEERSLVKQLAMRRTLFAFNLVGPWCASSGSWQGGGMRITHLGHSAVLVEVADQRLLLDPGNFSGDWHSLTDLDAVIVTHQHADHLDPEHVPALLAANPRARVYVEPQTVEKVPLVGARPLAADASVQLGGVTIAAVGGLHAVIHRDIPRIGNVGIVISASGEPTLFHPGDSLAEVPQGVDIVAIPAYGPWAAMGETIDFVRAVGAPQGFLIHEGLLNDRGRSLIGGRIPDLTVTSLATPVLGEAWHVG